MRLSTATSALLCLATTVVESTRYQSYLRPNRSLQVSPSLFEDSNGGVEDRVSGIDRTNAECVVGLNAAAFSGSGVIQWNEFNFYYAIHASAALDQEKEDELQELLFMMIQNAILWCTLPASPPIDVNRDGDRRLNYQELLQTEECKYYRREKIRTIQAELCLILYIELLSYSFRFSERLSESPDSR